MARLDFQVRHAIPKISSDRIHVLVQLRDSGADLTHLGFSETSRAGDILGGSLPTNRLEQLLEELAVVLVESTRQIKDELDDSIRALRLVDSADVRQIPGLGADAIIGIIDSGFELTHPCLLGTNNKTRILAAWDQVNAPETVGKTPSFGYGTEYSSTDIDNQAGNGQTLIIRNHPQAGAHGTAVAGIAAGNGIPFNIYPGVAPEANLVLVSYRNDVEIGGSAFVLDAISYILTIAKFHGKPVVINLSQGDNLGAHDGSSLLELAIDHLLTHEQLLIVNSAGNGRTSNRHTEGHVPQDTEHLIKFRFKEAEPVDDDTIDIWYSGVDRFSVALKAPTGFQSEFIWPDRDTRIDIPDGGTAHVYSELYYPTNYDNRISVVFGNRDDWGPGEWALVLRGDRVQNGLFHAWTDQPNAVSAITFAEPTENSIVTLPGTAEHIITVGGFVSRPVNIEHAGRIRGQLSGGSSLGPTRDNRIKPNITAPSSMIMTLTLTSKSDRGMPSYAPRNGTSMAAPHVAGVIALLWSHNPSLTPTEIRDALYASATTDEFTGEVPNTSWGMGKVDAKALFRTLTDLEREKLTMSTERIPFNLSIPDASGERIEMSLEILIRDGDIAGIEGKSGSAQVEGTLNLRRRGRGEGGDQCWICTADGCREVTPCPK